MSFIEISEEEAKLLRGSKTLMDQLLKSPKTRRQAEKLVKELYPDTQTTDDIAAPYIERLNGIEEKLDKYFKSQDVEKVESKLQSDLDYLVKERSYTPDGLEKIKEIMVKKSIPDAIVAADHWERLNPPEAQAPSAFQPSGWGFGEKSDDADVALLFKDEDQWAERMATKVWNEETKKSGRILT